MSNPRINKREREKAKRERAVAKAERRTERRAAGDDDVPAAGIVVLVLLTALGILVAINFALSV